MNISQSLIKAYFAFGACYRAVKRTYIDHEEFPPTDAMMKGRYFEYQVIGATRDGDQPAVPRLKSGLPSKEYVDLGFLAEAAKELMSAMGIEPIPESIQERLEYEDLVGHPDFRAIYDGRMSFFDLKYTETKADDRWNGWGDPASKDDVHIQAKHYIYLWHAIHGEYIPYYFLVFGKSGWVKLLKMTVSEATMAGHVVMLQSFRQSIKAVEAKGWPVVPEYNKCKKCPYLKTCDKAALIPVAEEIEL